MIFLQDSLVRLSIANYMAAVLILHADASLSSFSHTHDQITAISISRGVTLLESELSSIPPPPPATRCIRSTPLPPHQLF